MNSKHNKKVREEAKELKNQGYNVKADVPGFEQPPNFNGCRPDIYATKREEQRIIEIETPESMKTDKEQRRCLRQAAKKIGAKFETIKTDK